MENYTLEKRLTARKQPAWLCPGKCSISLNSAPTETVLDQDTVTEDQITSTQVHPSSFHHSKAKCLPLFPLELKQKSIFNCSFVNTRQTSEIRTSHMVACLIYTLSNKTINKTEQILGPHNKPECWCTYSEIIALLNSFNSENIFFLNLNIN